MGAQMPCERAAHWELRNTGEIHSLDKPGMCLGRTLNGLNEEFRLTKCKGAAHQTWMFRKDGKGHGTLSDLDFSGCLDNMQRDTGPAALGGCHGGATQQWDITADGKITSVFLRNACLGISVEAALASCLPDDLAYQWLWDGRRLRPAMFPELCLVRIQVGGESKTQLRACSDSAVDGNWRF